MSVYTIREIPSERDLPCLSCDRYRSFAFRAEFAVTPAPNGPGTDWMCGRCFDEWREIPG